MKEIWKKTSLLYKMIAVILTVVMVSTTLYFHFDKKYEAKAEGESYTFTNEDNPEETLTIEVKLMALPKANETDPDVYENWTEISGITDKEGYCRFAYFVYCEQDLSEIYFGETQKEPSYSFNHDSKVVKRIDASAPFEGGTINKVVYDSKNYTGNARFGSFVFLEELNLSVTVFNANSSTYSGELICNENSYIEVTATSGYQITNLKILDYDMDVSAITPAENLYTATYIYRFNEHCSSNTVISDTDSLKISVADANTNPSANSIELNSCTKITYDKTSPVIGVALGHGSTYDLSYDEADVNKWYAYNSDPITPVNSVEFEIKSGEGASETNLNSIKVGGVDESLSGSSAQTITKDLVEGTNTFVISASDEAGNTLNDKSFTFKVDNTAPVVESLTVGGYSDNGKFIGLTDNNVAITGSASDLCANSADGSGVENINITIKKASDNSIVASKDFVPQTDGTFSVKMTDYDVISEDALSGGMFDGSYIVSVAATDKVGHISDSKELKFTLDSTKPVITYALERHAAGDAEDVWEEVPSEDIYTESNTYYVNNVTYDKLRYKIEITETNLEEPVVCKNADSDVEIGNFEKDSTNPNTYYYVIDSDDSKLTRTEALSLKAVVKDKAENVNEDDNQILLPKLQLVDTDIKVELVEVWCDGEMLADISNLSDLASDFNKIYTIKVKAKSGFKMTDMELRIGEETYSAIATDEIGDNSDTTGIHTTDVVEFTLPTVEENKKFDALNVYVKNENENDASVSLGDLLYDNTVPVVKNNDTEVDYSKWYQDYTFDYEIKSGESAVESDLKNAKYSVDEQATELTPSGTTENGSIDVPESKSIAGTKIAFEAEDKATNTMPNGDGIFNIRVDKTAPAVAAIKVNGKKVTEKNVFSGAPQITSTITDNLTIQGYMVTVKYNDETYAGYPVLVNKDEKQEAVSYTLKQVIGSKDLTDGKYTVNISATDKSGRNSNVSSTTFVVDNTAPVVSASIISGTSGKSNGYYNTDVVVRITCKDNNFDASAMSVTDNGSAVSANWQRGNDIYYADIVLSAEGLHDIRVSGKDKAGTDAEAKQVSFVIDKTAPVVALLVNGGQLYNGGTLNLTGPLTLTASVTDTNDDAADLRVQIIKTVPDTATTTSEFIPTGERTFTFADEADYVVNLFSVDKANNMGVTRTISFRVDTTAPQITITGAGGTASSATSVSFNITEAFWSDASGKVDIYRKAGDGIDETLYKTLTISPTQKVYSISELLRESGIYRFEFNADDKVGHTATASQSITVDVNKPEINLSGVNNYDSTDGSVSISAIIKDEFYANKKVSIQGTRTDATGKKNPISFSPYAATANPTTINDTFTEEGIYDITITATDIAGNVSSNSVHFTIDTSEPVIGDLSAYDKKTFNAKSFEELGLDLDLDELVSDITVCDVRMYLNGSEYDGISEIEDGSYTLLITAEDELGHSSEKSATFVLDTKEPIFIVTGVEDGEVRNDSYSIEVSLQLDEDTLDEVKLNDTVITVKNNVASISVTDKGEYELYMKATDEAGNEAEQTISFTFGNEETSVATTVSNAVEKASSHWWIWAIVVAAILAVGGFIFFILKRRKED